jgi:catechol 2,3-dioxygenase-like lactoylglutathione lyase family enzyme
MADLNHTIINVRNKEISSKFFAEIIGLEIQPQWGRFIPVQTANGVTLDFADAEDFRSQHYAFILSDEEFDAALGRLKNSGTKYYSHFDRTVEGEINTLWGGRGVYFYDPSGHLLEMITKPYGDQSELVAYMKR